MKCLSIILTLVFLCGTLSAQMKYKFRVLLADKARTEFSLDRPEEFLSARALERRSRQGIEVDSTDLPVCADYVRQLSSLHANPLTTSRWLNTVVVEAEDSAFVRLASALPFVCGVKKVWEDNPGSRFPRNKQRRAEVENKWEKSDSPYGLADTQLRMHGGDSLHAAGWRGQGMHIAIIDAGFYNVDVVKLLRGVRLLGTKDFVNPSSDIFAEHNHGLKVLSCMAADMEHVLVGSAPEADYWLLRSEDSETEQPVEEDYWAAAVEFADSVGVDVVNTSLGYYSFDDSRDDYEYRHLDGRTSVMSLAASYAAAKGILVVVSAGNSGMDEWKKITPPADARGVLAVGAVSADSINARFSSIGNTADGRIKPDVMALGVDVAAVGGDGCIYRLDGTSFAAPVLCGLVACLWQACHGLTVNELIEVVRRSGDRSDCPDNIFGYGIPNLWKAYKKLKDGNRD